MGQNIDVDFGVESIVLRPPEHKTVVLRIMSVYLSLSYVQRSTTQTREPILVIFNIGHISERLFKKLCMGILRPYLETFFYLGVAHNPNFAGSCHKKKSNFSQNQLKRS